MRNIFYVYLIFLKFYIDRYIYMYIFVDIQFYCNIFFNDERLLFINGVVYHVERNEFAALEGKREIG